MDYKQELDKKLERLKHTKKRLEKQEEEVIERNNKIKDYGGTLTEHAGWEVGYYQGKLSILADWEDFLEEQKENIKG